MSDLWCEKDDHFWDNPDDLEGTYCLHCGLSPAQTKEVHRLETNKTVLIDRAGTRMRVCGQDLWDALEKVEAELAQLKIDCEPFMAQITQAKTYKVAEAEAALEARDD